MSDRLSFLGLLAVALIAAGWLYFQNDPTSTPPTQCTCRQLADNPTAYAGKLVRVSTAGTQVERTGLVWRRMSHDPPAVVLRGPNLPTDPVPSHLTGTCHAPIAGGPVTVTGCKP